MGHRLGRGEAHARGGGDVGGCGRVPPGLGVRRGLCHPRSATRPDPIVLDAGRLLQHAPRGGRRLRRPPARSIHCDPARGRRGRARVRSGPSRARRRLRIDSLGTVLRVLDASALGARKAEILAAAGLPETSWPALRATLLERGVVQLGARRGARYLRRHALLDRIVEVVASEDAGDGVGRGVIAERLGLVDESLWRDCIQQLLDGGRLQRDGRGRGTVYRA